MKKLCMLMAWKNFSEYYCEQLAEQLKDRYKTTITHDLTTDFSKFDIIMMFFPKWQIPGKNVLSLFWEPHEYCEVTTEGVHASCSKRVYDELRNSKLPNSSELHRLRIGVNTQHFCPRPFPSFDKIVVGWAGAKFNPRKRFEETKACIESISEVTFKDNSMEYLAGEAIGPIKETGKMGDFYETIHIYACGSAIEGFGLPILEASACGRPVVTFDVGIAKELQEEGAGIIIVESFDQMKEEIVKLAKDPERIKELGQKSVEAVKNYWAWDKVIGEWQKVFKEMETNE